MLNLNYNIINSTPIGVGPEKLGFSPYINSDPYSGSIISAIPGTLFRQDYDVLFGMTNIYDDISSYVRGAGVPVGSNRTISVTGSASNNITSSDGTPWDVYGYNSSLIMPAAAALNAGTDTGVGVGFNLTTSSWFSSSLSASQYDWVSEAWVALPVSSSYILPFNDMMSKEDSYVISLFTGKPDETEIYANPFLVDPKYIGAVTASVVMNILGVSGSNFPQYMYPTSSAGSNVMDAYQWHHIAFSGTNYICGGEFSSTPNRYVTYRGFFDGRMVVEQAALMCGTGENARPNPIQYKPTKPALLLGSINATNTAIFQDFRFYNGTNKNYTSSFDVNTVVQPIVIARPY